MVNEWLMMVNDGFSGWIVVDNGINIEKNPLVK